VEAGSVRQDILSARATAFCPTHARPPRWVWPPTTNRTGGAIQREKRFGRRGRRGGNPSFGRHHGVGHNDRSWAAAPVEQSRRARDVGDVVLTSSGRSIDPSKRPRGPNRGRGVISTAFVSGRHVASRTSIKLLRALLAGCWSVATHFDAGAAAGAAAPRLRVTFAAGAAFFAGTPAVEGPLAVLRAFRLACSAVLRSAA